MVKQSSSATKLIDTPENLARAKESALNYRNTITCMHQILDSEAQELKKIQAAKNEKTESESTWQEEWNKKYGAKETIVSISIKIINSLNKLMSLDQKTLATIKAADSANSTANNITDEVKAQIRQECKKDMLAEGYKLFAPTTSLTSLQDIKIPNIKTPQNSLPMYPGIRQF